MPDTKISQSLSGQQQQQRRFSEYISLESKDEDEWSDAQDVDLVADPDLALHRAIFEFNQDEIFRLLTNNQKALSQHIINKKDMHGNTPLHLACMLGHDERVIAALMKCGANIDSKNLNRWTPFHEACSYGSRSTIRILTNHLKDEVVEALNMKKLSEKLETTKNYKLIIKWEFQTWVPFLSRALPSDVCIINKQGRYIRIDTRLLEFELMSRKKGDSCLIYSDKFDKKWIIMNNKTKKYQHFETPNLERDIEDKIDEFMSSDLIDVDLKSEDIQLTRSTSGWIWRAEKTEKIGKYNAALYNFNNVFLVTRKRREHLSEEDLKRNKAMQKSAMQVLKFGKTTKDADGEDSSQDGDEPEGNNCEGKKSPTPEIKRRESLVPPSKTSVTWAQYCLAEPGKYPTLSREMKIKESKTAVGASIAMSEEFPLTKNEFLDLVSIIPLKMFKKLKEFIEMRLPDGFPIRLEIPVFPFLTARITFEDFAFIDGPVDESLFTIPEDYEEDARLFPLLAGKRKKQDSSG